MHAGKRCTMELTAPLAQNYHHGPGAKGVQAGQIYMCSNARSARLKNDQDLGSASLAKRHENSKTVFSCYSNDAPQSPMIDTVHLPVTSICTLEFRSSKPYVDQMKACSKSSLCPEASHAALPRRDCLLRPRLARFLAQRLSPSQVDASMCGLPGRRLSRTTLRPRLLRRHGRLRPTVCLDNLIEYLGTFVLHSVP